MSEGLKEQFWFPADWERHEAVWLAWPPEDWVVGDGLHARDAHCRVVCALLPHVRVELLVNSAAEAADVAARVAAVRGDCCGLTCRTVPHTDIWMRDFGPVFVRPFGSTSNSSEGTPTVLRFDWTAWGYLWHSTQPRDVVLSDETVAQDCAAALGVPCCRVGLASEGGDRSFNGAGVMIANRAVEQQRNPGRSFAEIDAALRRTFALRDILWVDTPGLPDDAQSFRCPVPPGTTVATGYFTSIATGGHVDELVRFVDKDTVVLAEVMECERGTPMGLAAQAAIDAVLAGIAAYRARTGHALRVLRVPLPPTLACVCDAASCVHATLRTLRFDDAAAQDAVVVRRAPVRVVASASYVNYLVTNGAVLVARYMRPGRADAFRAADEGAVATLRAAFPGRAVVQVDVEALNYLGGGMNCISQQQPVF